MAQKGDAVLDTSAGPQGDGRFTTVGDLERHIFSAENRYVEFLSKQPATDTTAIPSTSVEALFEFGRQSRSDLRKCVSAFPAQEWDAPQEFNYGNNFLRATPRKLIVHVLMHEIRHWAQIGTLLRLNGLSYEPQDFLLSPVMGGEFRRGAR